MCNSCYLFALAVPSRPHLPARTEGGVRGRETRAAQRNLRSGGSSGPRLLQVSIRRADLEFVP